MKIRWDDIELDKIADAWVLTYWLGGGNPRAPVLRLKIRHTTFEEPNDVEAEIQFDRSGPFISVHGFWISAYECSYPEECPDAWDALPGTFAQEFKAMLEVWGELSAIVSLGGTHAPRYANEPADSRDWYWLHLSDDLCDNEPRH